MPDGAADAHGEDLAAFVRALGLSKVRIVAHSSGAHTALFFAALHPDMVVSPALNEPPAAGILIGTANGAEILKEFASNLAPAREALTVVRRTDSAFRGWRWDREPDVAALIRATLASTYFRMDRGFSVISQATSTARLR